MRIGIDGSRAFLKQRTGIEEYSYQVIKNLAYRQASLRDKFSNHEVFLYLRKGQEVDFDLEKNWKIKRINWPYLWTQLGLSLEMIFNRIDVLFIPAHVIPVIKAKKTVVVVHGLEYEFCPDAYSLWERIYMRFFIKRSCQKADKIIAVSENTKKDLANLYKIEPEKIKVVYEGFSVSQKSKVKSQNHNLKLKSILNQKFLLFLGRVEKRKNVRGIIEAFEILKQKYKTDYKLVLAGKPGYGYQEIKTKIQKSKFKDDIVELGFVSEQKKQALYENAEVFLFPSFYEGFGLPILEAQSVGTPVVGSNTSSLPEVVGEGGIMVDPKDYEEMAQSMNRLATDDNFREDLIQKGFENKKRFSWEKCASQIASILFKK